MTSDPRMLTASDSAKRLERAGPPCSLHAAREWNAAQAFSDAWFPLTPALSHGERENRTQPRWETPRAKAFTLIELLLVIAVAAMLAALLLPSLARAKQQARTAQCLAQLHQLGLAMSLYADEHEGLLPMAHASVRWDSPQPVPWTRPLLPYYGATNLLTCPAYVRVHARSPFSYFMGARSAFIAAGGQPASVLLTGILFPAQYILSGDTNYPFPGDDADPDNYTQDTLFATNLPAHGGRVNILFADKHAATARRFDRKTMTYSHTTPAMDWNNWDL